MNIDRSIVSKAGSAASGELDAVQTSLDAGAKDRSPERTCIVTRVSSRRNDLLRFVVSPEGNVVPDLKASLPGRGAWTVPKASAVKEAVERNLFARAFRRDVRAGQLQERTRELLVEDALARLGLARKAGALVAGFVKCETKVRAAEVRALVHATDGSLDGVRKLAQAVRATDALMQEAGLKPPHVEVFRMFDSAMLGDRLGMETVVHAALLDHGAGRQAAAALRRLREYREDAQDPAR